MRILQLKKVRDRFRSDIRVLLVDYELSKLQFVFMPKAIEVTNLGFTHFSGDDRNIV
ncbi:hypothetical protein [Thalassolituus sp.]|uniref:hypothetical protein n=1 Tax=Thalassolituus sp. TaxID=2030822 RepID=UPI002A7F9E68|nr:hypothetical protein [Thalassolituus sp.]